MNATLDDAVLEGTRNLESFPASNLAPDMNRYLNLNGYDNRSALLVPYAYVGNPILKLSSNDIQSDKKGIMLALNQLTVEEAINGFSYSARRMLIKPNKDRGGLVIADFGNSNNRLVIDHALDSYDDTKISDENDPELIFKTRRQSVDSVKELHFRLENTQFVYVPGSFYHS